jgi:choline dehydrogenase-like flavoprotein
MNGRYDAVVVGGGIMGAIMAKQLAQNGKRVLLLEAGAKAGLDPETYRQYINQYLNAPSGVGNAPYPANVNAPSADVRQIGTPSTKSYLVQMGPLPFLSDYTRVLGGTTLHWQGTALRMVPNDFRMQSVYGQGVDWPFGYEHLSPYYSQAEQEIGVAADVEDQKIHGVTFPRGYVYPMQKIPPSYLDQYFIPLLKGRKVPLDGENYPVEGVSIPQGRNAPPNPDYNGGEGYEPVSAVGDGDQGLRCQGNSTCTPLCPVQAKYSALKTLASLPAGKVTIETQAVATKLIIDTDSGRIQAVEYKKYRSASAPDTSPSTLRATATVFVLAANAIENARLLLSSGAANSSDQVGRNLMDHPYIYSWGMAPQPLYPFRGPDAITGIETLRDGKFRQKHAAFRSSFNNWGWSSFGSPASDVASGIAGNLFGVKLRQKLAETVTHQVRLGALIEQLPRASNRVRIDPAYPGPLGIPKPVIEYSIDNYSLAGCRFFRSVASQVWAWTQVQDFTDYTALAGGSFQILGFEGAAYAIMGAGHVVGTHRMGKSRLDSVVNTAMRTWDHPNLYLAGCGNMPTLGTSNPTLTAAALTYLAAEHVIRDLS